MNSSSQTSIVGDNDEESAVADVAQTREYVLAFTNATSVVTTEFREAEELDGLYVGYDAERRAYGPERMHRNYTANALQPSTHPAPDGMTMPYSARRADVSPAAAEEDGTLV